MRNVGNSDLCLYHLIQRCTLYFLVTLGNGRLGFGGLPPLEPKVLGGTKVFSPAECGNCWDDQGQEVDLGSWNCLETYIPTYIRLPYLPYLPIHYITLLCFTIHYITVHYIELQYISYIYIYICMYIYIYTYISYIVCSYIISYHIVFPNGWFMMESPSKTDDLGVCTPKFSEFSIW